MQFPNLGFQETIDQIARQRKEFFEVCISMQTILKITFRDQTDQNPSYTPDVIYCLFKSHHLAKFVTVAKDGTETTYNLLDIERVEKA